MTVLFLLGRILLGAYFLYNGLSHFLNTGYMAQYAGSKGVPMPELAVIGAGVLLLIGGVSILLGLMPLVGITAIGIFLVGVSPIMHDFWNIADAQQRAGEMVNFLKNGALLGATLMLSAIPEPWPVSVGSSSAVRLPA